MKDKPEQKTFRYSYNKPTSDWFMEVQVELNPDDYYYYRIERRFGPSWWLIGTKPIDKPNFHWKDIQIGEISDHDLRRFIEWAKTDTGSKIIQFKCSGSHFDLMQEIIKLAQ